MDPFWCITLSFLAIRAFWKSEKRKAGERKALKEEKVRKVVVKAPKKSQAEKQRQKDIDELRKKGYTDELIAVIIPTINNGE